MQVIRDYRPLFQARAQDVHGGTHIHWAGNPPYKIRFTRGNGVLAFTRFNTLGIKALDETSDRALDLPHSEDAQEIAEHIQSNFPTTEMEDIITAIQMIKDAIEEDRQKFIFLNTMEVIERDHYFLLTENIRSGSCVINLLTGQLTYHKYLVYQEYDNALITFNLLTDERVSAESIVSDILALEECSTTQGTLNALVQTILRHYLETLNTKMNDARMVALIANRLLFNKTITKKA